MHILRIAAINVLLLTFALYTGVTHAIDTIKVGLLLPKSGVYASLGNEIETGFRLALEESGKSDNFEIVVEDTEVKPPVGLAKARKLVYEDEVSVIVGIVSSGVLAAMRDFIHQSQVPLIVANAGNNLATGLLCSPYIVRVSFSNSQINRPMGKWMYDQGIRTVYTLAPNYAAGQQMIDAFRVAFTAAGGKIVGGELTPFRKTSDFGPYLTNAKASGADALYVFYAGGEAISFVKQYDSFGLSAVLPLYGSGFLTSPLYVAAQGDAAIGITSSLHYVPTLDTPENEEFVRTYRAKFATSPSEYTVQGYDAGKTLMQAAAFAGNGDPKDIAEVLPLVNFVGPRGPMRIDPTTNNVIQNIYVYKTVKENGVLTQKVIDVIENVEDDVRGCKL